MLIIRQNIAENKLLQIFLISISAMLLINIWLNLTSRSQLQGEELFSLEGTWPDLNWGLLRQHVVYPGTGNGLITSGNRCFGNWCEVG